MISYLQAYYFYELVIHRKWEKKTHQTIHCCEQWNKLAEGEDSTTAQNTPPNTAALQQHYLFCTYIFKALLPCLSMHYTISSFFLGDLHSSPHSAMRSNGSLKILLESQLHSLAHFRERTKNNHKPFLLLEGIFFTSSTFFGKIRTLHTLCLYYSSVQEGDYDSWNSNFRWHEIGHQTRSFSLM